MTPDSALFILVFLPVLLLLFFGACERAPTLAVVVLPLASAIYCYVSDPRALPFLAGMILANYGLMQIILRVPAGSLRRSGLTGAGILLSLLPLVLYKLDGSGGLGIMRPADAGGAAQQPVPLGLAFYSLQQITYLIDAQKQSVPRLGLVRYCAWASLFCQLPAGPIAPYGVMAAQYADLGKRRPDVLVVGQGLTLVLFGVMKNSLVAGPLGSLIKPIYAFAEDGAIHWLDSVTAIWGFMLHLYFNFSAFSDVAIGLGLCLGLRLPVNFNSPLQARDVGDYVTRWHMSMMQFIRDYVFVPVFRLLQRCFRSKMSVQLWGAATIISYVAMGAWHSLSLNMIIASVIGASFLVLLQLYRSSRSVRRRSRGRSSTGTAYRVFSILLLLFSVSLAASLYRAETISGFWVLLYSLLGLAPAADLIVTPLKFLLILLPATFLALACPNTMEIFGLIEGKKSVLHGLLKWRLNRTWGMLTGIAGAIVLVLALTSAVDTTDFIYARF